ncbi:MAG: hypothetical protein PHW75_02115 [Patescibacteria group bacterium]|nr:hypothetical protein [Patescibacteria group bacterium]
MAEEVKETKQTEKPEPKSKKGLIIAIVAIIAVLVMAVLAFGFYNGTRVKNFAVDSEAMVGKTAEWEEYFDEANMDYENMDFSEYKATFEGYSAEAMSNVSQLESRSVPAKAKDLKANLIEYYTQISALTTDLAEMMDEVGKEMARYKSIEDKYTNALDNLDNMTISELEEVMNEATADVENIEDSEASMLASLDVQYQEIEEKGEAIGELEETILAQIAELKNVKFFLF